MSLREVFMPSYKRLLIASAKGGVGKSTTAAGLAYTYASAGKRVLLLDLDFTGRCLDMLTGCDSAVFDFSDVLLGRDISEAASAGVGGCTALSLLTACTAQQFHDAALSLGLDERSALREAVGRILADDGYDIVIADTGAGISAAESCADLFDMVLITSEQSRTSIRAAEYAAQRINACGARVIRLVICSFDLTAVKREHRAGIIEMIDESSLACLGAVPFDKKLQKSQDAGTLPHSSSLSMKAYANIAARLEGNEVPLFWNMKELRRKRNAALR